MTRHGAAATFTTVSVGDALRFVWRGVPLAAGFGLLAAAVMFVLTMARPVEYTAAAYLLSTRHADAYFGFTTLTPASLDPALYRAAVANGPVLDAALARLDGPAPVRQDVLRNLSVQSDNQIQSSIVTVAFTDSDASRAASVANLVADELVRWDLQRTARPLTDWSSQLEAELDRLDSELAALPAESTERAGLNMARTEMLATLAGMDAILPLGQLNLVNRAEVPAQPDSQRLVSNVALAIVVAVLAAYAIRLTLSGRRAAA